MKPLISSIVFMLFFAATTVANNPVFEADFDKIIEKEFPINADGTFEVINKYGAVNIDTWNKNAVSIKVIIEVKSGSEAKANKIFDRISIDFSNDPGHVKAETKLDKGNWNWGKDEEFKINYEVKMPASVHLNLSNKYGNSYVPNLDNGVELAIAYGNVNIEVVKGKTEAKIAYGNMNFEALDDLDLDVKYSNLNGESVGNLETESSYSQFVISQAGNIVSESKYDQYEVGTVGNFVNSGKYDAFKIVEVGNVEMNTGYTDLNIGTLHTDMEVEQKYGSIIIAEVKCEKGEIDIEGDFLDVVLGLDECDNFSIDFEGNYSDLKVPSDMQNEINKDGRRTTMNTSFGSGGKKIEISTKYGGLKIK